MKTPSDWHAGELESSMIYIIRPDLVHTEKASDESGADMARLDSLPYGYSGIWWYSKYPNHYAGVGSVISPEVGEFYFITAVDQLVELIKYLKEDNTILDLQKEFYQRAENPLNR